MRRDTLSERASLVHQLILSLDDPSGFDLGVEQEAEIARRVQMVREGTTKGRPAADVFLDINLYMQSPDLLTDGLFETMEHEDA